MTSHVIRVGCVGMAGMACIALITFAESPPPQQASGPTGWYWLQDAVACTPPPFPDLCQGAWRAADNWEWRSGDSYLEPMGEYPMLLTDDAYLRWSKSQPLVVLLSTEGIDSLEVQGYASGSPQSVTFESEDAGGNALSCDHVSVKAGGDETFVFTLADNAEFRTVD
jgi:hypothetical protein